MKLLDRIEFWHNKASDTKFVWFPFIFLKPEPRQAIDWLLKIKMIFCFGLFYGAFAAARSWIFNGTDLAHEMAKDIGLAILIFAFWFNCVTAPIWNMRTKRMNQNNKPLTREV